MAEVGAEPPRTIEGVPRWPLALVAGLVAVLATALTLWAGGAAAVESLPGIPAPSAEVTWLVPLLRLVSDVAAVVTVGGLLGAVFLVPGDHLLSPAGYRWVRTAGWAAAVWALSSLALLPVLLADFLGTGLTAVSTRGVWDFITSVDQARAHLLATVLALLVALTARAVLSPVGARLLLIPAIMATLPPAFTGHAAEEGDHDLAVAGVALHVVGVVLWAGGLLVIVLARRLSSEARTRAARRFSHLAFPLALVVAASGILTALTRLSAFSQLVETSYGVLVLVKIAALVALVALGWWHRRVTLRALAAGQPRAFLRFAAVELVVFAAAIGVAVGLGRTPTPTPTPTPPPSAEASAAAAAAVQVRPGL